MHAHTHMHAHTESKDMLTQSHLPSEEPALGSVNASNIKEVSICSYPWPIVVFGQGHTYQT